MPFPEIVIFKSLKNKLNEIPLQRFLRSSFGNSSELEYSFKSPISMIILSEDSIIEVKQAWHFNKVPTWNVAIIMFLVFIWLATLFWQRLSLDIE